METKDLEEVAALNQVKYVFDNKLNAAAIFELKYIGIENFKDGARWREEQMINREDIRCFLKAFYHVSNQAKATKDDHHAFIYRNSDEFLDDILKEIQKKKLRI